MTLIFGYRAAGLNSIPEANRALFKSGTGAAASAT
jgi:hypothetical protein